jgi:uncharacterized Zn-binding protein involved in type VI secretion
MTRLGCSPTVFAEGKPISRQTDVNTPHTLPGNPCPPCCAPISAGSSTVKINGLGCGRVGDAITACTSVAQGAGTVYAGG